MIENKKEFILETASELFLKYGVRSLTMDDIATGCGMSKKTIYMHFQNKTDLVNQFINSQSDNFKKRLMKVTNDSTNALDELNSFLLLFKEIIKSFPPSLIRDINLTYDFSLLHYSHFKKETLVPFTINNIKRGQDEKLYKEELELNAICEHFLNFISLFFTDENLIHNYDSLRMMEFYNSLLMYRITTEKGLNLLKFKRKL